MAASEMAWFRSDPPAECRRFFANAYPAMVDVSANLAIIQACGFKQIGHFPLPESAWWNEYYDPLGARLPALRAKHAADPEKLAMLAAIQMEIDLYRKYSDDCGNVFFDAGQLKTCRGRLLAAVAPAGDPAIMTQTSHRGTHTEVKM